MQPAKVNILVCQFAYGGNGGVAMTIPSLISWFSKTNAEMKADERIGTVAFQILDDTPITMTRNKAVQIARDGGYDMILMLDSDNQPDSELKCDPSAKPFWKTSFDFAYDRLMRGVPTVVCAPYCGKPPHENVFCFFWEDHENSPHSSFKLEAYSRHAAATMTGIQPIAAGPTGVTLYTTNAFDLMDPPYFYYEYKDKYETEKASTEDVTNFRDINLQGITKYGEHIVFANWDAWAAHAKVKYVRKPHVVYSDDINERFKSAILRNVERCDKTIDVDFEANMKRLLKEDPQKEDSDDEVDDGDGYNITPLSSNTSGVAILKRNVAGKVVKSVGHQTPIGALNTLTNIVELIAQSDKNKPLRCVEVGSWVGESAIAIAAGLKHGGTVYCVESFEGDGSDDPINRAIATLGSDYIKDTFLSNTEGSPVRLIEGKSQNVAKNIERSEADFVFIDAGHSYEDASADIEAWWDHVAPNGWMCGDDYCDKFPGVVQAVNEFFVDRNIHVKQIDGTDIWVVSKQEALACLKNQQK